MTTKAKDGSANVVFVFGSNLAGRHGAGSAKYAVENYGAKYGEGVGRTGNAYAIPTKDARLQVLPLSQIRPHVLVFLDYARAHSNQKFHVVAIGCGLAGYKPEDIAPMFYDTPPNVTLPREFLEVLR